MEKSLISIDALDGGWLTLVAAAPRLLGLGWGEGAWLEPPRSGGRSFGEGEDLDFYDYSSSSLEIQIQQYSRGIKKIFPFFFQRPLSGSAPILFWIFFSSKNQGGKQRGYFFLSELNFFRIFLWRRRLVIVISGCLQTWLFRTGGRTRGRVAGLGGRRDISFVFRSAHLMDSGPDERDFRGFGFQDFSWFSGNTDLFNAFY